MFSLFDPSVGIGLEIGPLNAPVVARDRAQVRYVDVMSRDQLVRHYAEHQGFPVDDIVDPDYVLLPDDGVMRSLPEAVGADQRFGWLVACHVVEHVPDLVSWLQEVGEVLTDDGMLILAVPDRRFSFDVDRSPTSVGQLLSAYERRQQRPSVRAVYDHYSRCMHINVAHVWAGGAAGPRMYDPVTAQGWADRARAGEYVDCHVWVWSPDELVEQLGELVELGLHSFVIEAVIATTRNDNEFYLRLRRRRRDEDGEHRSACLLSPDSLAALAADPRQQPRGENPWDEPGTVTTVLSVREHLLVQRKRRALEALKRLARSARRR